MQNPTCIVMWVQFFNGLNALRNKYSQAAKIINAFFTPFVVTSDGALDHKAKTFMCHLADKIWHKSHSEVLGYVCTSLIVKCWVMCAQVS